MVSILSTCCAFGIVFSGISGALPGEKAYLATLELGVETDTLDLTGKVVATAAVPDMRLEHVRETARQFVGKLHQVPPDYSAVRYQGKRAYQLARNGQHVDLKAREVAVHSLEILSLALPEIALRIRCSSGTYIRSLASDLGKALGTGGRLRSLRRTRSGPFDVGEALCSAEIGRSFHAQSLSGRVIPMPEAIPLMRELVVSEKMAEKVRQGWQPAWEELMPNSDAKTDVSPNLHDGWVKLVSGGGLVAILKVVTGDKGGYGRVKIERVFCRSGDRAVQAAEAIRREKRGCNP